MSAIPQHLASSGFAYAVPNIPPPFGGTAPTARAARIAVPSWQAAELAQPHEGLAPTMPMPNQPSTLAQLYAQALLNK